jgi:hypothetical protein
MAAVVDGCRDVVNEQRCGLCNSDLAQHVHLRQKHRLFKAAGAPNQQPSVRERQRRQRPHALAGSRNNEGQR